MTLAETLLPKLADWRSTAGPSSLTHHDPATGRSVTIHADRAEGLGCLVRELSLAPTDSDLPSLAERAERLAPSVTGLLESLSVHEIDSERGEAVLRSRTPAVRGDSRLYYEVRLGRDGAASVRRYESSTQPGQRRQAVPFALTHDAIAKLASDLAN